jgi:hypothetical protein
MRQKSKKGIKQPGDIFPDGLSVSVPALALAEPPGLLSRTEGAETRHKSSH